MKISSTSQNTGTGTHTRQLTAPLPVPTKIDELRKFPTPMQMNISLGKYHITSIIAESKTNAVYHAIIKETEQHVAIKVLLGNLSLCDSLHYQSQQQLNILSKLDHPNLNKVIDHGEVQGIPFYTTEYVAGYSLFHGISGQPIEPLQAAEITLEICNGVEHAHTHGILHTEINPDNIMLVPPYSAKVINFGLTGGSKLSIHPKAVHDGPTYHAPEYFSKNDALDERADIYSIGCTFLTMLTGFTPTPGNLDLNILSWCDPKFSEIINTCMQEDREKRYPNCRVLADDISALIAQISSTSATGVQPPSPERAYVQMPSPGISHPL